MADKPEKSEKPKGEKPEKAEKAAKPEKAEKAEKGAKPAKAEKGPKEPPAKVPTPRLQEQYYKTLLPALSEKFGRKNLMSIPKLEKIVVNMGVGAAITEKKYLDEAADALTLITGQKPQITRSRISIAGFKLRENLAIGCKVTLRGKRMYEFLDRLITLALPRVRDFRGLNPKAFDGNGNYSLGLSEQLVFPELNPDKINRVQGMNVTMVTSSSSDDEARELLRGFGMPFKVEEAKQPKGEKAAAAAGA